ncbi:hypothetical protein BRARA_D01682 [Brassica rapa]|uniref:Uncharacterized protein n=1 Tax=Brassica campestris TaxID=3711 RepID=A0A397ZLM6_BRACM|nr:hypothetical protein BRARA_D01682 [Brassica rapa]
MVWYILILLSNFQFLCFSNFFYIVRFLVDFSVYGEHLSHYVTLSFDIQTQTQC